MNKKINKCEECKNRKIADVPCYRCKSGIMSGRWDGSSILYICQSCGASIVGDGFWAACQLDETEYQVKMQTSPLSNTQILAVSKALAIPVLQIKEELLGNKVINKKFRLSEVMDFILELRKHDIAYEMIPECMYPNYYSCR